MNPLLPQNLLNPVQTLFNITQQQQRNALTRKLALAQEKRTQRIDKEKRSGRTQAEKILDSVAQQRKNFQTYTKDDLYQPLTVTQAGSREQKKNALRRYRVGKPLQQKLLGPSAYQRLLGNKLITQTADENIAFLRRLRDNRWQPADKAALDAVAKKQRQETNAAETSILKSALERGAAPTRARLAARLIAAQGAANQTNALYQNALSKSADRQQAAVSALEQSIANSHNRSAQVAQATDKRTSANIATINTALADAKQRQREITDTNTQLHNATVRRNVDKENAARKDIIDSRNKKLAEEAKHHERVADLYYRY